MRSMLENGMSPSNEWTADMSVTTRLVRWRSLTPLFVLELWNATVPYLAPSLRCDCYHVNFVLWPLQYHFSRVPLKTVDSNEIRDLLGDELTIGLAISRIVRDCSVISSFVHVFLNMISYEEMIMLDLTCRFTVSIRAMDKEVYGNFSPFASVSNRTPSCATYR